jgi:hypothetical protein
VLVKASTERVAVSQQSTGALAAASVGTEGWWLLTYGAARESLDAAQWITETAKLDARPVFE